MNDVFAPAATVWFEGCVVIAGPVVTVNGVPTTDFDYSAAGNSVTILSPAVGEGDVVEITYQVSGEC